MSLNGALQVGRSAMVASQAAMQVAGNNMANAATEGFHRRSVHLAAAGDEMIMRRQLVGTGVRLQEIRREIDTALQSRFRDASSDEHSALIDQRFLSAIEVLQNELTDNDLSSVLSAFFNSFSELANNPEDHAVRSLVVEQGLDLAGHVARLGDDYVRVRSEIDRALGTAVTSANGILTRIATLNREVTQTEQGTAGNAGGLRDQRDLLIDELAEYMDISVVEQANGAADVFVGSIPVVLAGESRGIELRTQSVAGQLVVSVRVASDGSTLQVNTGRIGGLMRQREETVEPVIDALDSVAGQLIFQVNRLHSQGQGRHGYEAITGTYSLEDTTENLNSAASGLAFPIDNGSFFIHVTHQESGVRNAYQINVDGNAMSLDNLINEINVAVGVPNLTAGTGLGNVLTLTAAGGYEISFSDDTSGALAALGINTFFTGTNASTMDVTESLQGDPNLIAAGAGHVAGSNDTALAVAGLQDARLQELGDLSLREFWQDSVSGLAVRTSAANSAVESAQLVRESLAAQVQVVSGVSLDEEAINLMMFQRQFQAAARFIGVIDEALQTLLSLV